MELGFGLGWGSAWAKEFVRHAAPLADLGRVADDPNPNPNPNPNPSAPLADLGGVTDDEPPLRVRRLHEAAALRHRHRARLQPLLARRRAHVPVRWLGRRSAASGGPLEGWRMAARRLGPLPKEKEKRPGP